MNEWSLLYYWTWVTVQWRWRLLYSVLVGLYRTWDDSFFHFSTSSDVISAFQIWKKKSTRRSFERQWTDLEQARSSCRCDKQHIIGLKLLIWLTPWIFDGRSFALRFWKTWDKVGFCFSPPLSLPSPVEQRNIERKRETQTESSSRKENINTLKNPLSFSLVISQPIGRRRHCLLTVQLYTHQSSPISFVFWDSTLSFTCILCIAMSLTFCFGKTTEFPDLPLISFIHVNRRFLIDPLFGVTSFN